MVQAFKETDLKEQRIRNTFLPTLAALSAEKTIFFDDAYECFSLGDVFYSLKRSPLVDVLTYNVFRQSFFAICELFTRPGTFEFYMEVFRAVWGDAVEVEFEVPSPGVLNININALSIENFNALARRIVSNQYIYEELITHDGDNIIFQGTQGLQTQAETDLLMYELHPAGIIVNTTLTVGEE